MSNQTATLPADVGLCSCNARNSLRATKCHACGETLPWGKAQPEPKPKAAGPPKIAGALSNRASFNTEALGLFGVGIVVFIIAFIFPIAGWWMYRYFSSEESPLATYAMLG